MEKAFRLLQTVATASVFSAVSFWYGCVFGREKSRKELTDLIDSLRRDSPRAPPSHPKFVDEQLRFNQWTEYLHMTHADLV